MVTITKEEKKIISKQYPNVFVARTMKHDSKRHHYYMTEDSRAMRLLRALREGKADEGNLL